ncbi:GFA family protein [Mesorhizobium sp. CN2-181]
MSTGAITGGCQCGAIRYRVEGGLTNAHICHCRMCQKAAGNYFMPLAKAPNGRLQVTRGEIAYFHSSDLVRRGFCRDCGTPLIFETLGGTGPNVTLGSLDDPLAVKPGFQGDPDAKIGWLDDLLGLPADENSTAWFEKVALSNHQHPDHDTETWPQEQRS